MQVEVYNYAWFKIKEVLKRVKLTQNDVRKEKKCLENKKGITLVYSPLGGGKLVVCRS